MARVENDPFVQCSFNTLLRAVLCESGFDLQIPTARAQVRFMVAEKDTGGRQQGSTVY